MKKYFVVYNSSVAYWCWEDEALDLVTKGWTLHAVTTDEAAADRLAEDACYI